MAEPRRIACGDGEDHARTSDGHPDDGLYAARREGKRRGGRPVQSSKLAVVCHRFRGGWVNAAEDDSETRDHEACGCSAAGVAHGLQSLFPQGDPSVNSGFIEGFFFASLAGGGWFWVAYSPSRAQL